MRLKPSQPQPAKRREDSGSQRSSSAAWKSALDQLRDSGFKPATRPTSSDHPPTLLDDITLIDDHSLMQLMNELIGWHEYAGTLLARAEVEEREADVAVRRSEAQAMVLGWGGGRDDRVAIAKAQRDADPAVQELQDAVTRTYAYRKMMANLHDSLERRVFLVSRELTRRLGLEPANRRKQRHGGA